MYGCEGCPVDSLRGHSPRPGVIFGDPEVLALLCVAGDVARQGSFIGRDPESLRDYTLLAEMVSGSGLTRSVVEDPQVTWAVIDCARKCGSSDDAA